MVKGKITICLIAVLLACVVVAVEEKQGTKRLSEKNICIRVGIFDSRAVAVAYCNSEISHQKLNQMREEGNKAKAAGNMEKYRELEQRGQQMQKKAHMQGFGTADVNDLLEYIKDKMPQIAQNADVDIVVSKWNIVYQNPDIKLVDITDEIVKAYNPGEKTLKKIEDLKKRKPISLEELEKMDHTKF